MYEMKSWFPPLIEFKPFFDKYQAINLLRSMFSPMAAELWADTELYEPYIRGATPIEILTGPGTPGESDDIGTCVYDRQSGLVIDNVPRCEHQTLMAFLLVAKLHRDKSQLDDRHTLERLADQYVLEGHGWFVSSANHERAVTISASVEMTEAERRVFAPLKHYKI